MTVTTLNQAIEKVMELPQEQQEMLLEIIRRRHIEDRRKKIASDAQESLDLLRAGAYKPQTAEQVIAELRANYSEVSE